MTQEILFQTEDDGSVRMTVPNHWINWRNVMNNISKRTFLNESYRDLLDIPGVQFDAHYLQFRFDNEEVAVQFKLTYHDRIHSV